MLQLRRPGPQPHCCLILLSNLLSTGKIFQKATPELYRVAKFSQSLEQRPKHPSPKKSTRQKPCCSRKPQRRESWIQWCLASCLRWSRCFPCLSSKVVLLTTQNITMNSELNTLLLAAWYLCVQKKALLKLKQSQVEKEPQVHLDEHSSERSAVSPFWR